jgi:23S rRNA pseudouridine1911/1915/1917 synthase
MKSRLDIWLAGTYDLTRTAAQEAIKAGLVLVDGKPGKPSQLVSDDARIEVLKVERAPIAIATESPAIDLDVVYEDDWLAVINKPAGMVVHPAAGHHGGTLADALKQRGNQWSRLGGEERAGIVHRLDRWTSGLLVVAKTEKAHQALASQLADHTLGRIYWALAWGNIKENSGAIDAPIARSRQDRKKMAIVEGGRAAQTAFRVAERLPETCVLDLELKTGRTHQIRVHLAYIKHPIVGDQVYGRKNDDFPRPALHARRLQLHHPSDGSIRVFESPLPDDLVALLKRARAGMG